MDVGRPTLDQVSAFLAVADEGSFKAAARRLGRAVSAISYAISTLEAQLGVTVFAREGSSRPVLTDAGRAILPHARALADEADELVAAVRAHNQGLENELSFALDVMCPLGLVAGVLRRFQSAFPTVDLRLQVDGLGAVAALLLDQTAQLAVAGPVTEDQPLLERRLLATLELLPVAAPDHPLARMDTISPGVSRHYRQLVLTDRSPLTQGREFGVLAARTWRLGDLAAKHALLLEGAGWGNMPRHMIAADLAAGRLVPLALPEGAGTPYPLWAAWRRDCRPGPASEWLLRELAAELTGTLGDNPGPVPA